LRPSSFGSFGDDDDDEDEAASEFKSKIVSLQNHVTLEEETAFSWSTTTNSW
jgi:hypothetical protein